MKTFVAATPGADLFVYEWGEPEAPAVLYWDGLGGTGLHANELGPVLADEFGLRVIAPDAPGHGRSPIAPAADFRPSRLAALAADLLTALEVERAAFLGFSWGAEVACPFGARHPERTAGLALVDGGYWDFADLPDFDTDAGLDARIAAARTRAEEDRYASWEDYFAAEREALGRWTPALEEAHRATMREREGGVVPILAPETLGAIHHGNCLEPTAAEHRPLRGHGVPVLLVTPADGLGPVGRAGVARFRANVPQLEHQELPGALHDLVSCAPSELASLVGEWLSGRP